MKIQSLGNGTGRPVTDIPEHIQFCIAQDIEYYKNPAFEQFQNANPALPLYLNNEPYMGSDVVEGERVWQAYDGFGPLRDNCWFDCRHPHEDYEALGIDTLEIYRITPSAPDNDKKVAEVREGREFKGTPGPWYAVEFAGYWNVHNEPFYEANNILDADKVGYQIAEINAQLIAAAPELLEALQILLWDFKSIVKGADKQPSVIIAKDAINKALGTI